MRPTLIVAKLGLLIAVLGGIDWGIIGIWKYNVVQRIFTTSGHMAGLTMSERVTYIVAGAGAIIAVPLFAATARRVARRGMTGVERETRPSAAGADDFEDRRAA
jgi:uncharacterized membrane protein YuzA (DUF378 family)